MVFSKAHKVARDDNWDEGSALLPCLACPVKGKLIRVSPLTAFVALKTRISGGSAV